MRMTVGKVLTLAALGCVATGAPAAVVTLSGDHIIVEYDNSQASLLAFGAPTLVGDLLTFSPSNFKALTTGGLDIAAYTVNLTIKPKSGFALDSIDMTEGGDYLVWGAASFVNVGGQTRLFDTSNLPPGLVQPIVPAGLGTISAPPSLTTTNWTASSSIVVAGSSQAGGTAYSYSIQNILGAFAVAPVGPDAPPTLALIEKKFVALDVSVAAIPEPEVWATMLVGAGLVGLQLRRKSRSAKGQRLV